MGNIELKQVLDHFFANETQNILIINGEWGVGKTHFWDNYINQKIDGNELAENLKAYSYVSLFGVMSLSTLQEKIITNTAVINESKYEELLQKGGTNKKGLIGIIADIPFIKNNIYDATPYVHNLIRDQVICFDDLERSHTDFSIETLMGYADELVHERGCKVIIIFNKKQLDHTIKEKFDLYREKVVDIEVTYTSSQKANFNIAFDKTSLDEKWKDIACERCLKLDINNIRVLKKIRYGLEGCWSYINKNEFPDKARDSFIQNFVSFYSLYLEEKEDRYKEIKNKIFSDGLRVSDVVSMGYGSYWHNEKKGASLNSELFRKYLLESSSIFDDDIVFYINNGYISSDFIAKSKSWSEYLQHEEKVLECKNKVSKIWDLYHSTLLDNLDVIIKM